VNGNRRTCGALAAGLLAASALIGCEAAGWAGFVAMGGAEKKVKAEVPLPKNSTLAVVIYMDVAKKFEYDSARLTLGMQIVNQLKTNLPKKKIRVLDARAVARYQDENIRWDEQDRSQIARDLKSDYVLFVVLQEYSTREPGNFNLFQGRISANAKLYSAEFEGEDTVLWEMKDPLEVIYPKDAHTNPRMEPVIRREMEGRFADRLAKNFYDHKVSVDPDEEFEGL
jgi:hypothetical protein